MSGAAVVALGAKSGPSLAHESAETLREDENRRGRRQTPGEVSVRCPSQTEKWRKVMQEAQGDKLPKTPTATGVIEDGDDYRESMKNARTGFLNRVSQVRILPRALLDHSPLEGESASEASWWGVIARHVATCSVATIASGLASTPPVGGDVVLIRGLVARLPCGSRRGPVWGASIATLVFAEKVRILPRAPLDHSRGGGVSERRITPPLRGSRPAKPVGGGWTGAAQPRSANGGG